MDYFFKVGVIFLTWLDDGKGMLLVSPAFLCLL